MIETVLLMYLALIVSTSRQLSLRTLRIMVVEITTVIVSGLFVCAHTHLEVGIVEDRLCVDKIHQVVGLYAAGSYDGRCVWLGIVEQQTGIAVLSHLGRDM